MLVRISSTVMSFVLITAALWLATAGTAHAYIDVETGSMILQVMLAGLFGDLFTIKVFWRQITGRFSNILAKIRTRESPQQ